MFVSLIKDSKVMAWGNMWRVDKEVGLVGGVGQLHGQISNRKHKEIQVGTI